MEERLKQRLVGAAVLVALAVVFIPTLLDEGEAPQTPVSGTNIPPRPTQEFNSRIVPLEPTPTVADPQRGFELAEPEAADSEPEGARPPVSGHGLEDLIGAGALAVGGADAPSAGVTAWAVQIGSFGAEDNATALVEKLRGQGYTAFMERIDAADGKAVFRVRVGPERTRAGAQSLRDRIEQETQLKPYVVRYP